MMRDGRTEWLNRVIKMKTLVIYYDKNDDLVLNYAREFSSEIYVYSPEPKFVPPGNNVISGNLEEVLDSLKEKIDVVAFRERNNYPMGFLKTGNMISEMRKRGLRFLMVH